MAIPSLSHAGTFADGEFNTSDTTKCVISWAVLFFDSPPIINSPYLLKAKPPYNRVFMAAWLILGEAFNNSALLFMMTPVYVRAVMACTTKLSSEQTMAGEMETCPKTRLYMTMDPVL